MFFKLNCALPQNLTAQRYVTRCINPIESQSDQYTKSAEL